MTSSLADARKIEELALAVEKGDRTLLGRFVKSLSLTADEERAVMTSLKSLPAGGPESADLGKSPPRQTENPDFWW